MPFGASVCVPVRVSVCVCMYEYGSACVWLTLGGLFIWHFYIPLAVLIPLIVCVYVCVCVSSV